MKGRKKGNGDTDVLDARTVHCAMCGTSVPFTEDGRCDLGHHVTLPPAESTPPPVEAHQAETGPAVPPAAAAAATPPPSAAAPEARFSSDDAGDDPFFHPYDDVLGEDPAGAPAAPAATPEPEAPARPEAAAPAEGLAPEELEDLLGWDDET